MYEVTLRHERNVVTPEARLVDIDMDNGAETAQRLGEIFNALLARHGERRHAREYDLVVRDRDGTRSWTWAPL
jgi:hypothetical protein